MNSPFPRRPVAPRLIAVGLCMLFALLLTGVAGAPRTQAGFYLVAAWLAASGVLGVIVVVMILRAARRDRDGQP